MVWKIHIHFSILCKGKIVNAGGKPQQEQLSLIIAPQEVKFKCMYVKIYLTARWVGYTAE